MDDFGDLLGGETQQQKASGPGFVGIKFCQEWYAELPGGLFGYMDFICVRVFIQQQYALPEGGQGKQDFTVRGKLSLLVPGQTTFLDDSYIF